MRHQATDAPRNGRRADGKGLRRAGFSSPLTPIRILRNRNAHYEHILAWNLAQHHDAMLRLTGWLAPGAAVWCFALDRFAGVCPAERIRLLNDRA